MTFNIKVILEHSMSFVNENQFFLLMHSVDKNLELVSVLLPLMVVNPFHSRSHRMNPKLCQLYLDLKVEKNRHEIL